MIHPDTEIRYVNDLIGVGVFATKLIPKGTILWVKDDWDIVMNKQTIKRLDEARKKYMKKYAYEEKEDEIVLCWDHARYMNHSFNPNCIDTAYELQLAGRDIQPGEQITSDYGAMGHNEEFECAPEEGATRTRVTANDYIYCFAEWDEKANEAFKHFNLVEQPLKYLIQEQYIDKVNAVANGTEPLDSILTLFTRG